MGIKNREVIILRGCSFHRKGYECMGFNSSATIREMVIVSSFLSIFALFPMSMVLFFGETLPLEMWLGGAWGLVGGILLGRLVLRNPNVKQSIAEIDHSTGNVQLQNSIFIGIIVGGSGFAHAVLFWFLGDAFFGFLIYGGLIVFTIGSWTMVIALWRDRKK